MVGGAGFEPAKAVPPDLQSGPFGRLGIHPNRTSVHGTGASPRSCWAVNGLGRELGITKERVRQIESRAQEKLRKIAIEEKLDPPML